MYGKKLSQLINSVRPQKIKRIANDIAIFLLREKGSFDLHFGVPNGNKGTLKLSCFLIKFYLNSLYILDFSLHDFKKLHW